MSTKKETARLTGWDTAIEDAKKRIQKLQTVIEVCKEKKAAGEPWPGENGYTVTEKAGTESVPA